MEYTFNVFGRETGEQVGSVTVDVPGANIDDLVKLRMAGNALALVATVMPEDVSPSDLMPFDPAELGGR